MRSWLNRLVVATLIALGATAAVDALVWTDRSGAEPPPCAADQLRLSIDVFDGNPFVALRLGEGAPCRLRAAPVALTVEDRDGGRVRLATTEAEVSDEFAAGYVRMLGITYLPRCAQRPPFVATVEVDRCSARRRLPPVGCIGDGSGASTPRAPTIRAGASSRRSRRSPG